MNTLQASEFPLSMLFRYGFTRLVLCYPADLPPVPTKRASPSPPPMSRPSAKAKASAALPPISKPPGKEGSPSSSPRGPRSKGATLPTVKTAAAPRPPPVASSRNTSRRAVLAASPSPKQSKEQQLRVAATRRQAAVSIQKWYRRRRNHVHFSKLIEDAKKFAIAEGHRVAEQIARAKSVLSRFFTLAARKLRLRRLEQLAERRRHATILLGAHLKARRSETLMRCRESYKLARAAVMIVHRWRRSVMFAAVRWRKANDAMRELQGQEETIERREVARRESNGRIEIRMSFLRSPVAIAQHRSHVAAVVSRTERFAAVDALKAVFDAGAFSPRRDGQASALGGPMSPSSSPRHHINRPTSPRRLKNAGLPQLAPLRAIPTVDPITLEWMKSAAHSNNSAARSGSGSGNTRFAEDERRYLDMDPPLWQHGSEARDAERPDHFDAAITADDSRDRRGQRHNHHRRTSQRRSTTTTTAAGSSRDAGHKTLDTLIFNGAHCDFMRMSVRQVNSTATRTPSSTSAPRGGDAVVSSRVELEGLATSLWQPDANGDDAIVCGKLGPSHAALGPWLRWFCETDFSQLHSAFQLVREDSRTDLLHHDSQRDLRGSHVDHTAEVSVHDHTLERLLVQEHSRRMRLCTQYMRLTQGLARQLQSEHEQLDF